WKGRCCDYRDGRSNAQGAYAACRTSGYSLSLRAKGDRGIREAYDHTRVGSGWNCIRKSEKCRVALQLGQIYPVQVGIQGHIYGAARCWNQRNPEHSCPESKKVSMGRRTEGRHEV